MVKSHDIVLASASPRRAELLRQVGWNPLVKPIHIDETPQSEEQADAYCLRMAVEKSAAANHAIETELPTVTADTIVALDGAILGKPLDENEAKLTLHKLAGKTHQVYSAVCVSFGQRSMSKLSVSQVTMAAIDSVSIESYVASGEPMDKAGSYGIQGQAAIWIERIEGSYSSIMGLPLYETTSILKALNVKLPLLNSKASQ
ncbi:Maf family protein [Marinicella sp. S1101]|uniref:Maf family protein n=1 Tax=Marinicella marina TaxID=2996016 RepID=UPI0022609F20|nr:Maf family protein [Marinicella marina]MCX7553802.1 Maf family protein [Marinicella marina]MDJ1140878.1 Maf family protein [Marinicella marina]